LPYKKKQGIFFFGLILFLFLKGNFKCLRIILIFHLKIKMSDAIFLSFPDSKQDRELADWCFWIDPTTCQATDDYQRGIGIMFNGTYSVSLKNVAVLCYATHPNSTKSKQDELYCQLHWVGMNVPLNNKQALARALQETVKTAVKMGIKYSNELALQLPAFLENPVWYATLLAAPEQERKKKQDAAKKRRPETYEQLQEQADRLYSAFQKTIQAMEALKRELPELPEITYNFE